MSEDATVTGGPEQPPKNGVPAKTIPPSSRRIRVKAWAVLLLCVAALGFGGWWLLGGQGLKYELLAVALGTLFYQGALRRYYKYKLEVQQLIQGRVDKLEEAKRASKDPQSAAEQVDGLVKSVAKLADEIKKLSAASSETETGIKEEIAKVTSQLAQRDVLGASNLMLIDAHLREIERLMQERTET